MRKNIHQGEGWGYDGHGKVQERSQLKKGVSTASKGGDKNTRGRSRKVAGKREGERNAKQ